MIKEHSHVMKSGSSDRKKYWKLRSSLSARMQALVQSAEKRWLGTARSYLLGSFADQAAEQAVDRVLEETVQLLKYNLSPRKRAVLRVVLSAVGLLRPEELLAELRLLCRQETDPVLENVSRLARSQLQYNGRRNPVILILDPELQSFPWESIPSLFESAQSVSRVPSLQFLR